MEKLPAVKKVTKASLVSGSRPNGRPSKLTPEIIDKAWEWLNSCSSVSMSSLVPTIEGLALELRISRETVYAWEKESDEFSDIVKNMRAAQAEKLIQNSLVGRYNPTIAKLMLSKHGYVEKTETDTNLTVAPILGGISQTLIDK